MISYIDLFWALLFLGLPMSALSWLLFSWLFSNNDIDRKADGKTLNASLKKLRKKQSRKSRSRSKAEFVYDKWMWFGGGFYGLAGVWTFAVIEISQFFSFLFNVSAWSELFAGGLVNTIVQFLLNQLFNMLQGLLWFSYWPSESMLLWILIAYLGYWVGVELARRSVVLPMPTWARALEQKAFSGQWMQRLRARFNRGVDQEPGES